MKTIRIGSFAVLLGAGALLRGQVKGSCEQPVETALQSGSRLSMHLRAGDIRVSGVNRPVLRVTCAVDYPEKAKTVSIQYDSGELRISGGPKHGVRFKIEVPRETNLVVRSARGDLTMSGVSGDKDIELRAGDVTIDVGNPADYKHADASVWAGNVSATPFGVDRDGLFKNFKKDNAAGKYSLHVRLLTGDVTLQ